VKLLRKLFGLDKAPEAPPRRAASREFDLRGFEAMLHYKFKDPELARQALTHRSYLHSQPDKDKGGGESNERMEFLGDSVVGLVVNEFLYRKFTSLREGELTKMKSLLVSRVILSRTAKEMGLGDYILLSEAETGSGGRDRASILADTLEGVIGAVYLDGGLEPARQLTERLMLRQAHEILSDANLANYKSMLQEYVQGEFKTHPQYRISSEIGPDHEKVFRDALLHFEKIVRGEKDGGEKGGDHRRRRRRGGRGRRTRGRGPGSGGPPQAGGPDTRDRGGREGRERREPDGRERREPDGDKAPWAASHLQSES